jgi:hypothetical protein
MTRDHIPVAWLTILVVVFLRMDTAAAQADPPPEPDPVDPVVAACLSSFDKSQALRREKRLLEAKKELVACSQQSCPGVVTVKCQQWLEEVKAGVPSIVVSAKDGGKDIFDVKVFIDDSMKLESLDGTALELDIGPRKIRAVRGKETKERTVLVSEGAKNRMVEFDFTPPKPPPPPVPVPLPAPVEPIAPPGSGFSMHPLSWLGFSLGLVGIVVGSITGGFAFDRVGELDSKCTSGVCDAHLKDEFAPSEALNHASTVSFAVGGAGIVLGVVGLFIDDEDESCQITGIGFSKKF